MTVNAADPLSGKSQTSDSRILESVLEGYLHLTKNAPAPLIFRKWAALFMIGAAMTRRCWLNTSQGPVYGNMMVLNVGKPSVGKGPAMNPALHILRQLDAGNLSIADQGSGIHMGPGDCTVAGLFDEFLDAQAVRTFKYKGTIQHFQTVILVAEELSAFMHHIERQMMGYLIKFLNCEPHSQRLRSTGETKLIEAPVLSLMGGVQPNVLAEVFPATSFSMGLAARTVFVYSDSKVKVSPFGTPYALDTDLERHIVHDMKRVAALSGPFQVTDEAEARINQWWEEEADKDCQKHPKLEAYNGKRILHMLRLCMIHSAARSDGMIIEIQDVMLALHDLLEVEKSMPHIFDSMVGEYSNADIIADLTHQIEEEYKQTGKPIPYHKIDRFIGRKVRASEIPAVLESLINQQIIKKVKIAAKGPTPGPKAFIPCSALTEEG